VSSQNEGEQPDQVPESWGGFDAFRARRADDRAQQQTQGSYAFPPEYAADPPSHLPPNPSPNPAPNGGTDRGGRRWRSVAVFAGVVALAVAVGFGAYEAVGSSGPAANVATGSDSPAPTVAASATSAAKLGRAVDVRVVVESIGTDSFTGHLVASGDEVTVRLDATTHFGTVARPLSRDELSVGETVLVRGRRSAPDTLTATIVLVG